MKLLNCFLNKPNRDMVTSNWNFIQVMDSIVKKMIGVRNDAGYKKYCEKLAECIREKIGNLDKQYSLKDIDKFLWFYGKTNDKKIIS